MLQQATAMPMPKNALPGGVLLFEGELQPTGTPYRMSTVGWGSYSLLTHMLRYSLKEEYFGLGKLQPADSQAEVLPKGGVLWVGEATAC